MEARTLIYNLSNKRKIQCYEYTVIFMDPEEESGCIIAITVQGGSQPYHITIERHDGKLLWDCDCADMTFKKEQTPGYLCKHLHALLNMVPANLKDYKPAPQYGCAADKSEFDPNKLGEIFNQYMGSIDEFLQDGGQSHDAE